MSEDRPGEAPPREDTDRWRLVSELFLAATELEGEERDAFLEDRCRNDGALRRELEELLAAHESEGILDRLSVSFGSWIAASEADEPALEPGSRVASYRLVRLIGEGGMGRVFLAERADAQFEQSVAIKMVRRGWHASELYERFLQERRILAALEHPNIARLLDGGLTESGQPFFAMEYVEGRPIDEHCDARGLGIEERLELFITVCEAVQFAHQNLVVHRDLKPGNILVTADGTPKLLDFGMARLVSGAAPDGEGLTRTGMLRMTPEYASPEQASGHAPTAATDTYALGVVLYELFTGRRPYELSGSPAEMERTIRTTEPAPPSERVLSDPPIGRTTGRRLQRRLSGDLDRIVLKALRKEPERRYQTAGSLAEDLRRHLVGLPVLARPDTLRYRTAKFVRRHRVGVAAAGLVGLSLVAGIVGTTTQARRATAQAAEAEREAARAELVSDFLANLFAAPDPSVALGEELSAADILERGAERLAEDRALDEEPETRANLLDILAQVYRNMGRNDDARPLIEEALELRRAVLSPDHLDLAESLTTLGILYLNENELDGAEPLLREALDIRLAAHGRFHDDVASAHNNVGALHLFRGALDSARASLEEAVAIRRELGLENESLATTLDGIAMIEGRRGDLEAATRYNREALRIREELLDPDHPQLARSYSNLATSLIRTGDPEAAEPYLRDALRIWRKVLGYAHPDVAVALSNLGSSLLRQGRFEEAEGPFTEALGIRRAEYPDGDHPNLAISLNSLGTLYLRMEDYPAAEAHYREALQVRERAYGPEHERTLATLSNLGDLYHRWGRLEEAERMLREALAARVRTLGELHHDADVDRVRLALVLADRGASGEARRLAESALERLPASPEDDSLVVRARRLLAGDAPP